MSRHTGIVLLFIGLSAGCEAVAGIDKRVADPILDATAGSGGSAGSIGGSGGSAGTAGASGGGAGGSTGGTAGAGQAGGAGATAGAAGSGGDAGASGASAGMGGLGGVGGAGAAGAAGIAGTGGAGGSAPCLPPGVPTLRVGNLIPDGKRYDVCLKSLDLPDPKAPPLLSKAECPDGLAYKDVTGLFHVEPGAYEIKLVDAAATTCDGAGLATLSPAIVADGKLTAVYALGDGIGAPTLHRYQESRASAAVGAKVRFLHAAPGVPSMDFGVSTDSKLPAQITLPVFTNVTFTNVAPPGVVGNTSVDGNGYTEYMTGGGSLGHALALSGKQSAILATDVKLDGGRASTVFLVGTNDRPGFPTQLYTCDEVAAPAGALARCANGVSLDLSVETYNTQLNGAFVVQAPSVRRAAAIDQIATSTSDVMCATEVWDESDKLAIAAAAKAIYPHSYWVKTDLASMVDDPTDAAGTTPAAYTSAACSASAVKFKAGLDCVRDNCVAPLTSEDGVPTDGVGKCMTSKCIGPLAGLTFGSADDKACWGCLFQQLNGYETVGATRAACTTDPKARYSFRGQVGTMVLSKYPISGGSSWMLPATDYRVNVLRTPITLPNGAEVDTYCSVLTTPATGCTTRPYTGQYGGGETDCVKAWQAELKIQTQKLIAHVQARSGALRRRAIIFGEMYSGPGYNDGTVDVIKARYPDIYGLFPQVFAPAAVVGDVPKCTLCGDNTWLTPPGGTPTIESTKTSAIFLEDIPITQVKATSTTKTDAVVMYDPGGGVPPYLVPASTYYGSKAVVRIEP